MIVITLTKVPYSLRGDLTKWCQEIQTGVYVGNVNARIRDQLWERIKRNVGNGEATLVYTTNNELGYTFRTTRRDHLVVDYDGIPLMKKVAAKKTVKHGFSKAARYHKARKFKSKKIVNNIQKRKEFIVVDVETTGLDPKKDEIISIGAVKRGKTGQKESFFHIIECSKVIPPAIQKLTGLTNEIVEAGEPLVKVLRAFRNFIGDERIVGYNLRFDIEFLDYAFKKVKLERKSNELVDLLAIVKKKNRFLDNYKLDTVLQAYGIENKQPHQALEDAKATFQLAEKLMEN